MLRFIYVDSSECKHQLECGEKSYNSLMELIFDLGYEDWGDCKGRAWCATCHVKVSSPHKLDPLETEEQNRLAQLSNQIADSRLACQIPLNENIRNVTVEFVGDD